jgi:hypothetical protein
MLLRSIELTHVKLVGIWALNDHFFVEDILKFDFVQSVQVAFESCMELLIHKKEERSPGILYG